MALFKCFDGAFLLFFSGFSFQKQKLFKAPSIFETKKMALTSHRSKRKPSGGRYKDYRKKRVFEVRNLPVLTKLSARRVKVVRGIGGNVKQRLVSVDMISVYDPKSKKYSQEKIKTIIENVANRHYARRNIMTKGAVVETAKGKVRITSRPGQEGSLHGVLVA